MKIVIIKNKRKQAGIKSDILEKLKKPFTSRNFEKSAQYNHKSELEGNIIMTEYTMNNNNYHRSQLNILNENSSDNTILNDIKNIPNLYLFDNEIIKFGNNPHISVFMFQNYLKLISFYELSKYNICLLVNLTIIILEKVGHNSIPSVNS